MHEVLSSCVSVVLLCFVLLLCYLLVCCCAAAVHGVEFSGGAGAKIGFVNFLDLIFREQVSSYGAKYQNPESLKKSILLRT